MIKSILLPINIAWFLNFIYNITIETEFITGNETLWSSQKVIAEIFGTISSHCLSSTISFLFFINRIVIINKTTVIIIIINEVILNELTEN